MWTKLQQLSVCTHSISLIRSKAEPLSHDVLDLTEWLQILGNLHNDFSSFFFILPQADLFKKCLKEPSNVINCAWAQLKSGMQKYVFELHLGADFFFKVWQNLALYFSKFFPFIDPSNVELELLLFFRNMLGQLLMEYNWTWSSVQS